MRKLVLLATIAALAAPALAISQPTDRPVVPPPPHGDYATAETYAGDPGDFSARTDWLEQRIHRGDSTGALSRGDAEHDFDTLAGIRQFVAKRSAADGGLSPSARADALNKLDNLTAIVRSQWHG